MKKAIESNDPSCLIAHGFDGIEGALIWMLKLLTAIKSYVEFVEYCLAMICLSK